MNTNVLKQHNILMRKTIGATGILKIVSNEDESSFLKKVTSFFIDKVSSLCDVFKSNENRLSSKYDTLKQRNVYTEELLKLRKDVIDITNTKDYFTIKHYNTPTVVGMRGNLLDILSVLEKGFELINKDLFENVEDLDVFLSTLISVEDTKFNSRDTLPNDNVIKLNKQLDKILRDAIDPKKVIDVDKIENLIPNLSSLKSVYERTINLESYTTSKAMLELQNSVSSITEKVNILISSLEDEEYEISKAMLKKVTTDMENTAQLVTNAASYLHLYNQLQFVVKNLILTIKDPSVSAESFSLNKKKQTVSNEGVIDFVKKLFSGNKIEYTCDVLLEDEKEGDIEQFKLTSTNLFETANELSIVYNTQTSYSLEYEGLLSTLSSESRLAQLLDMNINKAKSLLNQELNQTLKCIRKVKSDISSSKYKTKPYKIKLPKEADTIIIVSTHDLFGRYSGTDIGSNSDTLIDLHTGLKHADEEQKKFILDIANKYVKEMNDLGKIAFKKLKPVKEE